MILKICQMKITFKCQMCVPVTPMYVFSIPKTSFKIWVQFLLEKYFFVCQQLFQTHKEHMALNILMQKKLKWKKKKNNNNAKRTKELGELLFFAWL